VADGGLLGVAWLAGPKIGVVGIDGAVVEVAGLDRFFLAAFFAFSAWLSCWAEEESVSSPHPSSGPGPAGPRERTRTRAIELFSRCSSWSRCPTPGLGKLRIGEQPGYIFL
jgi:hypothetical protein